LPVDSASIAELAFLLILIWLLSGPISGSVLGAQTFISSIFTKSGTELASTKDLAEKVLKSSERIKALEAKVAQQQVELTSLRQQSKDTNKLRSLLTLKEKSARTTIAADVITRNADNWFSQIIIDRGSKNGVKMGSAVITSDGVVGQVTSVSQDAAVVRLLTDPDQKLGVVIAKAGITGILSGQFQNPAKISFVPVGANVDLGDKILCLGKGGTFPENHPVGTVCAVRRDADGVSLQIEVKLSENCYDLSEVLVVPPLTD